jgi:hypothetical protein
MARLLAVLCAAVALLGVQAAMADIIWEAGPSGPSYLPPLAVNYVPDDGQWELPEGTDVQASGSYGPMIKDFLVPEGGFHRGVYYIDEVFNVLAPPDWTDWEMTITSGNAKFARVDEDILWVNGLPSGSFAVTDHGNDLSCFFDSPLASGTTVEFSVGIYLPRCLEEGDSITIAQYPSVPEPSIFVALAGLVPVGLAGCVWRRKRASV